MSKSFDRPSVLSRVRENRVQKASQTQNLVVRLTEDEMKLVAGKALQLNVTRSEYCRGVILGHRIRDKTPETRELNQYQKYLNTYGYDDATAQKIKDIIDWFHKLRNDHINKEVIV